MKVLGQFLAALAIGLAAISFFSWVGVHLFVRLFGQ
jgi:hypothetical protein